MEHCKGGDLLNLMKSNQRFSAPVARFYFLGILKGMSCLHENCFAHRDLKPDNIFLDEWLRPKIGDFGNISSLDEREDESLTGTLEFLAPE
jgi:serine/threonine protein kinase